MKTPAQSQDRALLVVCSNPPTTSGMRTLNRVNLAGQILGAQAVTVKNLCTAQTYRTGELAQAASAWAPWREAQSCLQEALVGTTDVLLAYGLSEPTGAAREHRRSQIAWLEAQLAAHPVQIWTVGGAPRHPSRWQRYTFRCHPGAQFPEALRRSLTLRRT